MPLSLSIPPENIIKPEVFWCFQGVQKETVAWNGLKSSKFKGLNFMFCSAYIRYFIIGDFFFIVCIFFSFLATDMVTLFFGKICGICLWPICLRSSLFIKRVRVDCILRYWVLNLFWANDPLETQEKLWFSVFRGYRKGTFVWNDLKGSLSAALWFKGIFYFPGNHILVLLNLIHILSSPH